MNPQINNIIRIVAKCYDISPDRIIGKERTRAIKEPRRVAYWLCVVLSGQGQVAIGHEFGRGVSAVNHGITGLVDDRSDNPELDEKCTGLLNAIRDGKKVYPNFTLRKKTRNTITTKPKAEREHIAKDRKCLMCSNDFQSSHIGERVCPGCKETKVWKSGGIAA